MSYSPTTWESGDTITSAKLNKIEQGIASAGGGAGGLVVRFSNNALDKTWQEIHDAAPFVVLVDGETDSFICANLAAVEMSEGEDYVVIFYYSLDGEAAVYVAETANSYPVKQ